MERQTIKGQLKDVQRVYSFWGRFPGLYAAQDLITFFGRAGKIRREAVEAMNLAEDDEALEVACGSGRNLRYIIEQVGHDAKVIGFDYSQEMLDAAQELCNENGWGNVKLIQGDAAQLEIGESSFDGVISVLGISAIPDWEKALQRCYEVLKPGGKLVVCDARLFSGIAKFLNPLVKSIYSRFAAWDHTKNIPKKMQEIFGNVEIKNLNFGTFFIAVSIKE